MAATTEYAAPAERARRGRAARANIPRSSHAALDLSAERDPLGLLEAQDESRVAELVPIRYGRMAGSRSSFFRGAAAVMAHDLADTPTTGLTVQLSGDAHLTNFGGFASPERDLVFDLNDFDETLPGPFEWDVKRLAASFEIVGRDRDFGTADRSAAVREAVRSYGAAMAGFAEAGDLAIWYAQLDAREIRARLRKGHDRKLGQTFDREASKAERRDGHRALAKLTHTVDGQRRFVPDPPFMVPVEDVDARRLFDAYRRTLPSDRRVLLDRFRFIDLARKVVGIGSVGRRCWVVLLLGRDRDDPLFLQVKEAERSALEPLLGRSGFANAGRRVVEGQRLLQAASDILLGWLHVEALDGAPRDFYVRQLWDWKASVDVETILPSGLFAYARACGWALARAHARSGDPIAIAGYLGKSGRFEAAVAEFATAYADRNDRDHSALVQAIEAGRVSASESV